MVGAWIQLVQVSADAGARVARVERRHGNDRCDDLRVAQQRHERVAAERGRGAAGTGAPAGDPGPGGGGAAVPAGRRRLAPVAVLVNDDVVDALPMVVVHVL